MSENKVAEIMKTDEGKISVRWEGSNEFNIIDDDRIGQYLVYLIITGKDNYNGGRG